MLPLAPKFPEVGEADFWRKVEVYRRYQRDLELELLRIAELKQQKFLEKLARGEEGWPSNDTGGY